MPVRTKPGMQLVKHQQIPSRFSIYIKIPSTSQYLPSTYLVYIQKFLQGYQEGQFFLNHLVQFRVHSYWVQIPFLVGLESILSRFRVHSQWVSEFIFEVKCTFLVGLESFLSRFRNILSRFGVSSQWVQSLLLVSIIV